MSFSLTGYPDRPSWLARRREGIGGTDAAAILGRHQYVSPLDVWLDKRGLAEERPPNEVMEMGLELEPVIARRYVKKTGRQLMEMAPFSVANHPTQSWAFCSPDRIVVDRERGLELKSAGFMMRDEFGEEGTDHIPEGYLIQSHWCMAITGIDRWDVAVLIGGQELRVFHVERDLEFENVLIDQLGAWWEQHIMQGNTPAVDGSRSWSKYIEKRFPRHEQPMLAADGNAVDWARTLANARKRKDEALLDEEHAKNQLKAIIGDAEGIQFAGEDKITWRKSRDGVKVDYEAIATSYRGRLERLGVPIVDLNTIERRNTSPKPGSRRFVPTLKGVYDE